MLAIQLLVSLAVCNGYRLGFKCPNSPNINVLDTICHQNQIQKEGEIQNYIYEAQNRIPSLAASRYKYVRVTLERDTPHLGSVGEIVTVNKNYAFNYLIPFGFARYTSRAELVGLALQTDYKEALKNVRRASAIHLKSRLGDATSLEFKIAAKSKKSRETNTPIRPIDIITRMRKTHLLTPLDLLREEDIVLDNPNGLINEFGTHKVNLKLDEDITATIQVLVTEEPLDVSFME